MRRLTRHSAGERHAGGSKTSASRADDHDRNAYFIPRRAATPAIMTLKRLCHLAGRGRLSPLRTSAPDVRPAGAALGGGWLLRRRQRRTGADLAGHATPAGGGSHCLQFLSSLRNPRIGATALGSESTVMCPRRDGSPARIRGSDGRSAQTDRGHRSGHDRLPPATSVLAPSPGGRGQTHLRPRSSWPCPTSRGLRGAAQVTIRGIPPGKRSAGGASGAGQHRHRLTGRTRAQPRRDLARKQPCAATKPTPRADTSQPTHHVRLLGSQLLSDAAARRDPQHQPARQTPRPAPERVRPPARPSSSRAPTPDAG